MPDHTHVTMEQLRVGLYIYLDLKWFEQPFVFGHFRIKDEEQIRIIRSLGLARVRYSPQLSTALPLAPAAPDTPAPVQPEAPAPEVSPALEAKRVMIERIRLQREATARVENAYADTANTLREIDRNLYARPAETVQQATRLVTQIADSILSEPELAIHVMGDKPGGEEMYFHSLNVTILSMMMARDMKLPAEAVTPLGMGAMFHDIGHKELPPKLLQQQAPFSGPERHLYEMHAEYGYNIGRRLQLAAPALAVIREHHEFFDGSGYPAKLKGDAISLLARIVAIANHYDQLCNPANINDALTPHEALSLMFAKLRSKFDPKILQLFIRCLGVYPPGTIVQLSNGVIGLVTTVNTNRPMKPMIMIYDAAIPKKEAVLVDLEHETEVNIAKAIRPAQVPREVYDYLSPRKRVSYYFDAGTAAPAVPPR
ncbi:MAG: HD-GYP domain-containing protein [Pseudomonadota bacterium]